MSMPLLQPLADDIMQRACPRRIQLARRDLEV
jgi:hypothetical protein